MIYKGITDIIVPANQNLHFFNLFEAPRVAKESDMEESASQLQMSWLSNGVSVTGHMDDFIRYTRCFNQEKLPGRLI